MDLLVIGAGIVGLSVAHAVLKRFPDWTVGIIDKKKYAGDGVSGRNSGVIHSSLYYEPDSLKARLCLRGNELTYQIADQLQIPYERCGKLVVAVDPDEEAIVDKIFANARQIGAKGIRLLSAAQAQAKNHGLHCVKALYAPNTGIIDPPLYMKRLLLDLEKRGALVSMDNGLEEIVSLDESSVNVRLSKEQINVQRVVSACGLQGPEVARLFGISGYETKPNRGEYYLIKKRIALPELIYPVPEQAGLGIHLTKNIYNEIYAGPSAVWTDRMDDYSIETPAQDFCASIARYFPEIKVEDLQMGYAGIRPKISYQGTLQKDFQFVRQGSNVIHLLGIESPGLTSAPAIGEYLVQNWLCLGNS